MKRFFIMLIIICSIGIYAQNSSLDTINGCEVLNVWGSNYEMGYGHGYALNSRIPEFFIDYLFNGLGLSVTAYNFIYSNFWNDFTVPDLYCEEAGAVIDGIEGSGSSIYIDTLGRDLDSTDILIANAIVDIDFLYSKSKKGAFGCSSLSAWGRPTESDSLIRGNIIMARNLDYSHTDNMLANAMIMTFDPDSANEWLCFSYPGIITPLSGMNSDMTVTEVNVGYHRNNTNYSPAFTPFLISQRMILETGDYDGNDSIDFRDAFTLCKEHNNPGSWLCHTIKPYADSAHISAAVIECPNESADTFRLSIDDHNFYPYYLLMLNHEEVNYTRPPEDPRYQEVLDSVNSDSIMTSVKMWSIMTSVSNYNTIQTMLFLPNDSLFFISFADPSNNASYIYPSRFKWSDLFPNHQQSGVNSSMHSDKNYTRIMHIDQLSQIIRTGSDIYTPDGRKLTAPRPGIIFILHNKKFMKFIVID
ncbi:MAG: hypothetical protein R6U31_07800 [bacterium]